MSCGFHGNDKAKRRTAAGRSRGAHVYRLEAHAVNHYRGPDGRSVRIWQTPREEEPQIIVPMLDVIVQMPGATRKRSGTASQRANGEAAARDSRRRVHLFHRHPGEHGRGALQGRNQGRRRDHQDVQQTLFQFDRIPPGVSQPLVKVRSIDDVPILALTLWGKGYDAYRLRQVAAELEHNLKQVDDVSETQIIGGQPRQVRVVLDPRDWRRTADSGAVVINSNARMHARGRQFASDNSEFQVEAGRFLARPEDLKQMVVAVKNGRPVYLRDVVQKLVDGPAEPTDYVLFGNARGSGAPAKNFRPSR